MIFSVTTSRNACVAGALSELFHVRAMRVTAARSRRPLDEIRHEAFAAEFAVGEDVEAQLLLLRQDAQDLAILDFAQARAECGFAARASSISGPQESCRRGRRGMRLSSKSLPCAGRYETSAAQASPRAPGSGKRSRPRAPPAGSTRWPSVTTVAPSPKSSFERELRGGQDRRTVQRPRASALGELAIASPASARWR